MRGKMNAALGAGLGMVSVLVIIAIFCDVLAPNNPDKIDMSVRFAERSFAMPLGADAYGRCIFSRLLYGTRYSMGLAAAVIGTVAVLATPIGMIAAFKGGDAVLMLSGFSFLGIGLPAGTPEWGALLSDAKSSFIRAPRFAVYPGLCIFFAVCACNITGEGLRRFFSPYQGTVQEHIYQTTKSVSKGVLPNEIVQESIDE